MAIDNITLQKIISDFTHLLPELWLVGLYVAVVCLDLLEWHGNKLAWLTALGVAANIVLALRGPNALLWGGMLQTDGIGMVAKIIIDVALVLTLLLSVRQGLPHYRGEYYSTLLGVLVGAHFLVMSRHFLMLFLSVEVISVSSYVLVYLQLGRLSSASALRYLIFGATASAVSLYGFSLLYGLSGSFVMEQVHIPQGFVTWGSIAIFLAIGGLLFKLSIVPFHFWITGVYEQAPLPVLAFLATVPKIAAGVGLLRLLLFLPDEMTAVVLAGLALASVLVGNLGALGQHSGRKLLAFSSVGHAGFLLACLLPHSASGVRAFLFYAIVYVCMSYAIFYLLQIQEKYYANDQLSTWQGTGLKQPFLGVMVVVLMISLTGLPITAGFTAKFFVFSSVWEYYQLKQESLLLILIVVGLLSVAISLFFYLKIPYLMFLKLGSNRLDLSVMDYIILIGLVLPVLVLFFIPDEVMYVLNRTVK